MKIHYLCHNILGLRSAANCQVMRMCQAFGDVGCDTTLYARRSDTTPGDLYDYYGVRTNFQLECMKLPPLDSFWGRGLWYMTGLIRRLATEDRPDIFYGRTPTGLILAAQTGVPIALEVHEPPRYFLEREQMRWIFRQRNLAGVVAITHSLKDHYLKRFPSLDPACVSVAPDGADLIRAGDESVDISGSPDGFKVGYVGSLYRGRGITMITRLARELPQYEFHVIGGGEEDVSFWKDRAGKLSNLFLYGFVEPRLAPLYCTEMNVLIAPYGKKVFTRKGIHDTAQWASPLKVFEYMAAGKPMIASDIPVLREVLRSEHNALTVPPDDMTAWVAALERLRSDPQLCERLATTAQAELAKQYTWQKRAKSILEDLRLP